MKSLMLPYWKSPAEGCEPPAGVRFYESRTLTNVVTASTSFQSIVTRIRTCSQEKLTTRLFTLQSPFLVPILKTVTAASGSVRSLSRARTWKGATQSVAVMLMIGCSPRLRVGSPQFQHAPELICIIVINEQPDNISAEVAEAAIAACRGAAAQQQKEAAEAKKL